ncbi:MAG: V-type ATP synthase subunit D [Candidatus Xenobiia bacterium LiM19]
MGKLSLSKSSLQKEHNQLKLYTKMLPSLDLKRQQLTMELAKSQEELVRLRKEYEELKYDTAKRLPMLTMEIKDLAALVKLESVNVKVENVVGVRVPVIKEVHCSVLPYSMLAKPSWVDMLVERLKRAVELYERLKVAEERVKVMEKAKRRITQRVNLFDKVLIPTSKRNIKRIQTFLGDSERTSVVRSKLAKTKQTVPTE